MGVGECDDPVMWPSQRLHTQKVLALWLFFHFALLIPLPARIAHKYTRHAGCSYFNIKCAGCARIKQAGVYYPGMPALIFCVCVCARCDSDFQRPTTLNKIQNLRVLRQRARIYAEQCARSDSGVLHNGDLQRASGYIVIARWKYFNLVHIVRVARQWWSFVAFVALILSLNLITCAYDVYTA